MRPLALMLLALASTAASAAVDPRTVPTQLDPAWQAKTRALFKQVIEIPTVHNRGEVPRMAGLIASELEKGGFPAADIQIKPYEGLSGDKTAAMIFRWRAERPTAKPILLLGHMDVVEAKREDWTTDPFKLVEKDGYFYGRGTQDMKGSDAIAVADLIRLKKEGFVPNRDIILALTADEENGKSNGVEWLLKNRRELVDAEYVLNPDSGQVHTDAPVTVEFEATEKLYADYEVMATNAGGHSSLPVPNNAIYHVANALTALQHYSFPAEVNAVTHEYFEAMAKIESGQTATALHGVLQTPLDPGAVEKLSKDVHYNSTLRTTCVATMLAGGHAPNALPQRALANVNCRIFPGHPPEEIRQQLVKLFNDPDIKVGYKSVDGTVADQAPDAKAMEVPPLRKDVMKSLNKISQTMWPGATVVPRMEVGASDSVHTMAAGIPSYGICGLAINRHDDRMHGRDERLGVESFYNGLTFYYLLLKDLTR